MRRAAAAHADDLVAVADFLAGKLHQLGAGDARFADQPVTLAVRDEPEIAGLEQTRLPAVDLEPAAARRHDVKHQGFRDGRQLPAPTAR